MQIDDSFYDIYLSDWDFTRQSIGVNFGTLSPYTTTEADLIKKLTKAKRGRFITQMYAGVCAIGTYSFGMVVGWSSPITYEMLLTSSEGENATSIENIEDDHYAWIISITALGCCMGIFPAFLLLEQIGPRLYMILANFLLIILWGVMAIVTTYSIFMVVRLMTGFAAVSFLICGETILTDCTTKYYMRYTMMMFNSSMVLGIVITYVMGGLWGKSKTCTICCSVCAFHILLLYFAKDSPVILYARNPVEAIKALAWYLGKTNIQLKVKQIKKQHERRRLESSSDLYKKYLLSSKAVLKGTLTVFGLIFFEVSSGYYALLFYNVSLFREFQHKDSQYKVLGSIYFGVCLWIVTVISSYIHYPIPCGVKKPLMISSILITFNLAASALYLTFMEPSIDSRTHLMVPVILFGTFIICFEAGLSFYPKVFLKDVLPDQVYPLIRSLITFFHWLMIFFMLRFFFPVGRI
ncbi:facilitated trehalose transporter Tret1-like [Agrilus planipennis]|uniref:Facilitated trehalose transporter Tret1-like n=1 Tax=Agrilus planipennis TaxID=224129 RepID=A0A7F5RG00_AGRPL|nr:facilitated trehalose transporter Tret1-like [Agrilus planipennis]